MATDSGTPRRPMSLVVAAVWFGLALWSIADGEPFWGLASSQVGMGVYFVGSYVFHDSNRYENVTMLAVGLLFTLTPDAPWWLRALGALGVAGGLFLTVRAIVRSQLSNRERSRATSSPT